MKKLVTLILIAAMLLTGCSLFESPDQADPGMTDETICVTNEVTQWYSFNPVGYRNSEYYGWRNTDSVQSAVDGMIYNVDYDYSGADQMTASISFYELSSRSVVHEVSIEVDENDDYCAVFAYNVNGETRFEVNRTDEVTDELTTVFYKVTDLDQGTYEMIDIPEDSGSLTSQAFNTSFGTVLVRLSFDYSAMELPSGKIILETPSGSEQRLSLDDLTDTGCYDVNYVVSYKEALIVSCVNMYGISEIYTLDPSDLSVVDAPVPDIFYSGGKAKNTSDGRCLIKDTECLYEVTDDGTDVLIRCGYTDNLMAFVIGDVVDVADDCIYFVSPPEPGSSFYINTIYSVTPSDFPYEGKERVDVGVVGSIPELTAIQINRFNLTNDDYYAVPVILGYEDGVGAVYSVSSTTMNIVYEGEMEGYTITVTGDVSATDYDNYLASLESLSERVGSLVESTPGLDVIVTSGEDAYSGINDYLEDLVPYMDSDEEFDRDSLFENILSAAYTGDSLYRMPLLFYVNGIAVYEDSGETDRDLVTNVTYSDYSDIVENELDGSDPIAFICGPIEYAEELISSQYDLFVDRETGEADFHNAAFFALLDYISGLPDSPEMPEDYNWYFENIKAEYSTVYSITDGYYYNNTMNIDTWMSLPTYDGRGPSAAVLLDIGMLTSADDSEGAWAFIRFASSMQGERSVGYYFGGLPINREVMESSASYDPDIRWTMNVASEASCLYTVDLRLRRICNEVLSGYISGEITADEAADMIESAMNGNG